MTISFADYLPTKPVEPEPTKWNLGGYIKHWSPSSFDRLNRCPRQWQQHYLQGRRERPSEGLLVGSVIHAAAEMNFRQKIDSHEDLPLPQALDYFDSAFPATVQMEQERVGEEAHWDTSPELAQKRGRTILGSYLATVAPRIQPIGVELFVSVDMGLPVPVEGRADIETEHTIIDLKSGKRAERKPKESWLIQAIIYGAARGKPVEFHSMAASPSRSDVTIYTPLESPELLVAPTLPERRAQTRTFEDLSDMACFYMAKYGPDESWPTLGRFHSWACSFCGVRSDCPAWSTT